LSGTSSSVIHIVHRLQKCSIENSGVTLRTVSSALFFKHTIGAIELAGHVPQ